MTIRLYAWTDFPNFGDALSKEVVSWVSGHDVRLVGDSVAGKLVAIGSVLQRAQPGDVIWGTGVHPAGYEAYWKNKQRLDLTVLAVRGPITRDVLLARHVTCPAVYGDPAILMPKAHPRKLAPAVEAVLLPHFSEYGYFSTAGLSIPVINPFDDWRTIIDSIVAAHTVISTSLHGIIVPEAYGVPAIWYRPSQYEGYLKYEDYYAGTGRSGNPITTLEQALKSPPPAVPDLSTLQSALIESFKTKLVVQRCSEPLTESLG